MDFNSYKKTIEGVLETLDNNEIDNFIDKIVDAYKNDKFVFVIGNGGSAANASHLAQDLAKGTRHSKEGARARTMARLSRVVRREGSWTQPWPIRTVRSSSR